MIALLDIRPGDPYLRASALSGGNQQKVLFARWLIAEPDVLLLDEPTHGVDIGAKTQIQQLIGKFVADGGGAMINSAEFPELMGLCDEIYAMKDGQFVARLDKRASDYSERSLRTVLGG